MSVQVKVLKAFQGDCIWIRYGKEHFTNIIIDSGPSKFKKKFQDLIMKIYEQGENVDLLIFTHIDNDHIGGACEVLADNNIKCEHIKKIWINTATKINEYFNLPKENEEREYSVNLNSANQEYTPKKANKLIDIIIKRNIEVEQMIMFKSKSENNMNKRVLNDAWITILSPTEKELKSLVQEWEKDKLNTEFSSESWNGVDIDNILDYDEYIKDGNKFNGSSIAFLFKYCNVTLVLLGDSYSEVISKTMECYKGEAKIDVDLIKLSHHGSSSNTYYDLLNRFNCANYAISTNGTNNNPDKRTIARIVKANNKKKINLYSNYNWWENTNYFTKSDYDNYIKTGIINKIELNSEMIEIKEGLLISNE